MCGTERNSPTGSPWFISGLLCVCWPRLAAVRYPDSLTSDGTLK